MQRREVGRSRPAPAAAAAPRVWQWPFAAPPSTVAAAAAPAPAQQQEQATLECQICYERRPEGDFLLITEACTHSLTFCRACVSRHVREEVTGKNRCLNVICPAPGCTATLQAHDVRRFSDPALFARYDHLLLMTSLRSMDEFRWCANPNGCGNGQLVEDAGDMSFFRCSSCYTCTCVFHRVPWHSGITCEQFEQHLQIEDHDNDAWKAANTKNCPSCHRPIEKVDGCDVMRCCTLGDDACRRLTNQGRVCDHGGLCGQRFCWLCLGLIDADGTRHHLHSCQYHFEPPV